MGIESLRLWIERSGSEGTRALFCLRTNTSHLSRGHCSHCSRRSLRSLRSRRSHRRHRRHRTHRASLSIALNTHSHFALIAKERQIGSLLAARAAHQSTALPAMLCLIALPFLPTCRRRSHPNARPHTRHVELSEFSIHRPHRASSGFSAVFSAELGAGGIVETEDSESA